MKPDWTKDLEKWIIRLTIIQGLILVFGQVLMSHTNWSPLLNRAIQDEGVLKTKQTETVKTMEPSPAIWYDSYTKNMSNP